jgi:2-iminoacetate synthase ThiH
MIRALRDAHAGVHIKALTAVEIAHLARIEKTSILEVLLALKDAGLTSLPGGGAEVFGTAVRATIADRKLAGEEWMAVHRQAHALGIPSNCTMLYGHVETARDRAEHLLLLRGLQDESGGFLTHWVTMGLKIGQVALRFGANDFGSVMMEENVVSAAGTTYRTSVEEMEALIRGAGFTPVRRRQDYSLIREAA